MYRLAFYQGERVELNFLPSERAAAEAMGQGVANLFGKATLMFYDASGINIVEKFFQQRNIKAVA